jgi:hydrogenase/urease accessory protein HupE
VTYQARGFDVLSPDHRQFAVVIDEQGAEIATKLLNVDRDTLAFTLTAAPAPAATPTFAGFLRLGVEHIWTGYDHLLFLFALLVVCGSFRSIAAIISCFTLAHSLTLALATLDLVHLPARFVEPAIAASIVFVGCENLWRRGAEPRGRWVLTFAFGLVHGFGFASVLRDLGVGDGGTGVALPLVAFNLGVELGQIAIAAIVLPLIWQLRKRERFVTIGIPALSSLVAAAGTYWLLERTVFS